MTEEKYNIPETIKVLVEHDVKLIRDGIQSLLEQNTSFTVVNPSSPENGYQAKQEQATVDIVLTVSELANGAATDHINRIKNAFPDAKVVVIGVFGTEKESLEYIEAGASGYILPDSSLEHLIEAIHIVQRGEASCPPVIMARLFERVASLRTQLQIVQDIELSSLTQRELEVLQLVAEGMSNKEIATSLKLELQTVKNHIHNILEKLRVRNRREAVACTRRYKTTVENNK